MTLGGLSLAIGMLVDDATVEVEEQSIAIARSKAAHGGDLDGARRSRRRRSSPRSRSASSSSRSPCSWVRRGTSSDRSRSRSSSRCWRAGFLSGRSSRRWRASSWPASACTAGARATRGPTGGPRPRRTPRRSRASGPSRRVVAAYRAAGGRAALAYRRARVVVAAALVSACCDHVGSDSSAGGRRHDDTARPARVRTRLEETERLTLKWSARLRRPDSRRRRLAINGHDRRAHLLQLAFVRRTRHADGPEIRVQLRPGHDPPERYVRRPPPRAAAALSRRQLLSSSPPTSSAR